MTTSRDEVNKYLQQLLSPQDWDDYCPNGLQIEGSKKIKKISFAVSATKESIEQSVSWDADALVVHHGLFWKFHGVRTITNSFAKRIKPLIQNDINLFAYHLPLDAHEEIGHASQIAQKLGGTNIQPFGNHKGQPTGVSCTLDPLPAEKLKDQIKSLLKHDVLHSCPTSKDTINSLGIITGGANGDWVHAERNDIDAYLTGEMSEHDWHEAKESGIHMYAGGHNATEEFGLIALMDKIKTQFPDIKTKFFASENPA